MHTSNGQWVTSSRAICCVVCRSFYAEMLWKSSLSLLRNFSNFRYKMWFWCGAVWWGVGFLPRWLIIFVWKWHLWYIPSHILELHLKYTSPFKFQEPRCQLLRMLASSGTARTPCEHTLWTEPGPGECRADEPGSEGQTGGLLVVASFLDS